MPVYAVGESEGICYYAMQFIEGRSLAEHLHELRQTGTRPGHDYYRRVARWGRQVAEALAYNATADIFNGRRVTERVADREIPTALGWLLRGLSLSKLQRSGAIEAYDRAIKLRPDFTPAIQARAYYRGMRLIVEGERAELKPMLNDCDALVTFWPASSRSYAARADGWLFAAAYASTQEDLRQFRESWLANCENDLKRALGLRREDDSFSLGRRGRYLRYVGDLRGSAEAFARAIAVDRAAARDPAAGVVHEYAIVLYAIGDLQAALEAIEPLCDRASTYYSLFLQRAILLAELGRLAEARNACRECMTRYHAHANALFLSVAMMELLGDSDAAAAAIAEFVSHGVEESTSEDAERTTPGPAASYLSRQLSGPALVAAAQDDAGRRCEFTFLIGLRQLGEGDRAGGLGSLQACLDTQVFTFGEHRFGELIGVSLQQPTGVALAPGGRVLVTDMGLDSVEEFNATGAWRRSHTSALPPYTGVLSDPTGVVVDEDGRVMVCDTGHRRVVEVQRLWEAGDLNCDRQVDGVDISAFVLALCDSAGYAAAYSNCDILNGDFTDNGAVEFADIQPFVDALLGS